MNRTRLTAGCAVGALCGSVAIAAAGDTGFFQERAYTANPRQAYWTTEGPTGTGSREFRPIAGLPQGTGVPVDYNAPSPIAVSVDLRAGKAQLRLVDGNGDITRPFSVTLAGKGVSTAQFATLDDGMENPRLEWRRLGRKRVEARSVIVTAVGELD
jgi:hypothetical protein